MAKHPTSNMLADATQAAALGKLLCQSGKFPAITDPAEAAVKILAGKEVGLGPIESMGCLELVDGATVLKPSTKASLIQRSVRHRYRVVNLDDRLCEIHFYLEDKLIGPSVFTAEDAARSGLTESSAWRSRPRDVLFEEAISQGASWYCPELFGGAVSPPGEIQSTDPPAVPVEEPPADTKAEGADEAEVPDGVSRLVLLIKETGTDVNRLLDHYGVATFDELSDEHRQQAIDVLTARRSKNTAN